MASRQFEWQGEEEGGRAEPPEAAASRPWSRFLFVAALLVAVLLAGRQLSRHLEAAAAGLEADVLAAHNVARLAARQGDAELLAATISGRDPDWTAVQQELAAGGRLFAPAFFGTPALAEPAGSPTVTLSADLSEAEVRFLQPYELSAGEGMTRTVVLQQTAIYRRGETRWLLSPPEAAFWGDWERQADRHLSLTYPARDREVAVRLAGELEAQLAAMCRELADLSCPEGLHVELRLESSPESLLAAADFLGATTPASSLRLSLPAPTLVGLPTDEAGYQALSRAYAGRLVSAVITHLVGYDCCRHGLFYRALLERQLHRLGLAPWPLAPADYARLLEIPFSGHNTFLWYKSVLATTTVQNWQHAYSLVEFVLEEAAPASSAAEMQRRLTGARNYREWLYTFLGEEISIDRFVADWLDFVYRRATAGRPQAPPIPLPDQDIQLTCRSDSEVSLYRYNPLRERWRLAFRREADAASLPGVSLLPGEQGFLLNERWQLTWQRDEEEIVVLRKSASVPSGSGRFFNSWPSPGGRYQTIMEYDLNGGQVNIAAVHLLDLSGCTPESCPLVELAGYPTWSPGGRHLLLTVTPRQTLYPEDAFWGARLYRAGAGGESPVEIGNGSRPFWLDEERYGYLRRGDDGSVEIVVAQAGDGAGRVLLRQADLLAALPPAERPSSLYIALALANPADAEMLLVAAAPSAGAAFGRQQGPFTFFAVHLEGDRLQPEGVRRLFESEQLGGSHFSPDGRWFSYFGAGEAGMLLHLLEWKSGRRETINVSSLGGWSADGRWILQSQAGYLILAAPAYGYRHLIPHQAGACQDVRWVEQ